METSIDPLTKEEFVKTRENQRFANAVNRIAYHNRKANSLRKKLMVINRPLLKNNQILMECLGRRSFKTFHKEFLKGKGFLFGVFTHYQEHEEKHQPSIYDFIIVNVGNDQIKVINSKTRTND
jgi:hypothetical protein